MHHNCSISAGRAMDARCPMMRRNRPSSRLLRALPRRRVIGNVCVMLLVLSGCCGPSPRMAKLLRIPGLRGPDPAAALPADFNGQSSSESSAQIGIVEFFNDPVLTDLITSGLAQNQELKIRNEEIQIANNEILARRGFYLPFVSAGARGGFERHSKFMPIGAAEDQLTAPGGRRFSDPLGNTQLGANLFWRIDIWRQYRNAQLAAVQRFDEAVEARNYLITRLVAETAENYYELASLDKRLVFLN